ncbi:MAG: zf-HC2 domain-containing protein [Gemmatimonadaceae bacterium]|nr:zf-HC2 domain-containing protein [Gemmatimonadaceae bacterium]
MTQHPEEGTLHAYIDGELSPAEAATLELHVGECARCAAALAEARGFTAAASRVITTLDAAPSSAVAPAAPLVVKPSAPARRAVRPPIFRLPYARAAALLLLVGGTAVVVDRTGTFARGRSSQAESLMADAATASEVVATPRVESPTATAPAGVSAAAAADLSTGAGSGTTGDVARDAVAPPRVVAGRATDGARRARPVERSAPPPESARAGLVEQRGVAGGMATKPPPAAPAAALAGKDAAPTVAQPTVLPVAPPAPPPPARPAMRLEEVVVTSAPMLGASVSRYRTRDGTVLTLTEEPLRTSFAEESAAARRSAAPELQRRAVAQMAAPVINSYRWSSPERGMTYTLSGPLTVAELEALSKRLSELERVP